ncbi:MAG: hypothetical protein QM758_20750 [Armatimonas sp.]
MEKVSLFLTNQRSRALVCISDSGIHKIEPLDTLSKKWEGSMFLGTSPDNKSRFDLTATNQDRYQYLLVCSNLKNRQTHWSHPCDYASIGSNRIYSLRNMTLTEIDFNGKVQSRLTLDSRFGWESIDPSGSYALGISLKPEKHAPDWERTIYLLQIRTGTMYRTGLKTDYGHNGIPSVYKTPRQEILLLTDENTADFVHLTSIAELGKKITPKHLFSITDYLSHHGTEYYLFSDILHKNSKLGIRPIQSKKITWKHLSVNSDCEFPYVQTRSPLPYIPIILRKDTSIDLLRFHG